MADDVFMIDHEAEADKARHNVAATIDALQDRLNPRRVIGEAVDSIQAQGADLAGQARDIVRSHPLAIGAVGIAIGLALFTRSKLANAKVNLGDDYRGYTDYDDGYGAVEIPAVRYPDEDDSDGRPTQRSPDGLSARANDAVESNPLVSIVVGLAAGALLGALFPASEQERSLLGDTGDRLSRAARAAARTARAELDSHGLSLDAARTKATDVAQRAKASVRSVVDAATGEFKGPVA